MRAFEHANQTLSCNLNHRHHVEYEKILVGNQSVLDQAVHHDLFFTKFSIGVNGNFGDRTAHSYEKRLRYN